MTPTRTCLALLVAWPAITSCTSPGDTECPADDTAEEGCDDASVRCSAIATPNPYNDFSALVNVVCDQEAEVRVEYGEGLAFDRSTPTRTAAAEQSTEVVVLGLRADRDIGLRVVAERADETWTGPDLVFHTAPLPEGWPPCAVTAPDPTVFGEAEVVCTNGMLADERPIYFCVDRAGEPVWELKHPEGLILMHMRPLRNGNLLAGAKNKSIIVVFDEAGRLLAEYEHLWLQAQPTRFDHRWVNFHEAIELAEGPWAGAVAFMSKYTVEYEGEDRTGAGLIVLDPDTDEVLWDWSAHGELGDGLCIDPALSYDRRGQFFEAENKWLHANALVHGVDPTDGKQYFWMSVRAQDWIIKIDPETDEIVWRLGYEGDFELVDDLDAEDPQPVDPNLWMYQQHAPEWTMRQGSRTRFLVFDNGVQRPDPLPSGIDSYTRVVEFEIDEATMLASPVFSYGSYDPDDPAHFYTKVYGDSDLIQDGAAVISAVGYPESDVTYLFEVGYPGGEERWRLDCPGSDEMYRVNWFPSVYDMTWWYDREL